MAVSTSHSPFMFSISVTGAAASLYSYAITVYSSFPKVLQFCQIQLDASASGATLYIGNSNVASNMCGAALVPTQATGLNTVPMPQVFTQDVYLLASTGTVQVNVIATPR